MQHYLNDNLIRRYRRSGILMTLGGLGITLAAAIYYFVQKDLLFITLGMMFIGAVIAQMGTSFQNRFGHSPRADEIIDSALERLNDNYAVYHYFAGTAHALFTPYRAYALIPKGTKDNKVIFSSGYGRADASYGAVFPWVFTTPTSYWFAHKGADISLLQVCLCHKNI